MANIVIHLKPAHISMGPTGFVVYARDFLNAYKFYKIDKPFSPAKYYLVCRSVELSLKSYLSLKKVDIDKLKRNYGHDLSKIYKKAVELGITEVVDINHEEAVEIEKANKWYCRKGFEYFGIQNIVESKDTLPDLEILLHLAERSIEILKPICLASAQKP